MDDEQRQNIDDIEDVEVLRKYLRETTIQLQTAAAMGLTIAEHNSQLQEQLADMMEEQEDMKQRLNLMERDRRWLQKQSLHIDQVKETLGELTRNLDSNRNRNSSIDSRIGSIEGRVEKMRDEMDQLEVSSWNSPQKSRKWSTDLLNLQRDVKLVSDHIYTIQSKLADINDRTIGNESLHRTQHLDMSRSLGDLAVEVESLHTKQAETGDQVGWIVSRQNELEQSLRAVISEYNAMLNEHEQTIRLLADNQAILESQMAMNHNQRHSASHSVMFTPTSNTSGRRKANGRYVDSAGPINEPPLGPMATPVSELKTSKHHYQQQRGKTAGYPDGNSSSLHKQLGSPVASSSSKKQKAEDAVVGGETLGDIFANEASPFYQPNNNPSGEIKPAAAAAAAAMPSPPPSLSQELDQSPIAELIARTSHTVPSRKAASVIGTPNKPKQRVRPRNSSFSKLQNNTAPTSPIHSSFGSRVQSPTKLLSPTGRFGGIISSSAHVGVGWGNYWEARRHRLQFDIQHRLGLPSAAAAAAENGSVSTKGENQGVDVGGSGDKAAAAAAEELGIED
ncbi:hypothetical protein GGI12_003136 [Dipsacomyces acuminosporus]|nr:hypothetical protein GGI12_003136 [Dipsacomyces acuminosporus]